MPAFPLRSLFACSRVAAFAAFAATAAVLVFTSPLHAQSGAAAEKRPPNPGEKTIEAFGKLKAMHDAKDWDGMIKLLDGIPGVTPGSYDEALILDTKAKIYGAMEQFGKALQPWERALELSEQHGYFPASQTLDIIGHLAQLYAQEALGSKDPQIQKEFFGKSLHYFRRSWEKGRPPTPESLLTYSSLLFHQATANPNQPEPALLAEARDIVDRGLLLAVKPKDGFYQMRLALLQQQSDLPGAAELVELLLHRKPDQKDYWQALVNIYQQVWLKEQEHNPALAREYLVRAILTLERAQAHGFLTSSKDNLSRASLYLSANQLATGTELLHAGLKNGTIESEPNNWRLLGRFYQENNQPEQARTVLVEAARLFPTHGEIELQLAHLCIQMENTAYALRHAQAAAAKGNFETAKPFSVHYLIAYTAFDLGRLDEAQAAIAAAEAVADEAAKDAQFAQLKTAITDALAENERKAREAAAKAATEAKRSGGE